jgi:aspartyl-tRNA(Asn)/glutamyl-tRNA(Gln) amidotransferase subunit C
MSDTPVDTDEVAHIANLARIDLDEDEAELFVEQFADILSYCETIEEVPEIEDDPELTNVMRSDEIEACLDPEDALGNAEETEDGYFKGPRVS